VGMLPVAERDMRQPHRGGADGVSSVLGDGRRCPSQPVDYRTSCRGRVGGDVNGVQRIYMQELHYKPLPCQACLTFLFCTTAVRSTCAHSSQQ
jgi:hypothetical protein